MDIVKSFWTELTKTKADKVQKSLDKSYMGTNLELTLVIYNIL